MAQLLNILVHNLLGYHHHHDHPNDHDKSPKTHELSASDTGVGRMKSEEQDDQHQQHHQQHNDNNNDDDNASDKSEAFTLPCCSHDPIAQINQIQQMAHEMERREQEQEEEQKAEVEVEVDDVIQENDNQQDNNDQNKQDDNNNDNEPSTAMAVPHPPATVEGQDEHSVGSEDPQLRDGETADEKKLRLSKAEAKKLSQMSLNTAVAIGLHNFPGKCDVNDIDTVRHEFMA